MASNDATDAKVQWMTLGKAARALGLSAQAFREVRAKLGWRRAVRDDGTPWFAIPLAELEREAPGSPCATSLDSGYPTRVARATAELIAAKSEAESRAAAAVQELEELREQLARIESERDAAHNTLRAAEAASAEANRQAEVARQEAASYARLAEEAQRRFAEMPWWRRLRGAAA